jgi:hypothetical protein
VIKVKKYFLLILLIPLVILTIFLTACNANNRERFVPITPKDAWLSQLNSIEFPNVYRVNYYKTYTSSGGTRMWNYTYTVRNETIVFCDGELKNSYTATYSKPCNVSEEGLMTASLIQSTLVTYNIGIIKTYGDTVCYYNMTEPSGESFKSFVCINNHNIVSYGSKGGYGGMFVQWYVDGYPPEAELYQE